MIMSLELKPSYRLAALLAAAHGLAAGGVAATDLPLAVRLLLVTVLAASCARSILHAALLRTRDAIVALEWNGEGEVNFRTRDGLWREARLAGSTFVSPMLTVLNLRPPGLRRMRHAVLMGDSAGGDEYRRLRVRLQWERTGYA